jgi:hypothetical protein
MIFWAYLSAVLVDPGKPPAFWVTFISDNQTSWRPKIPIRNFDFYPKYLKGQILTKNLGLLLRKPRRQASSVLFDLSQLQTGKMPSLLGLRALRAQHGPPLPVAAQLRRV